MWKWWVEGDASCATFGIWLLLIFFCLTSAATPNGSSSLTPPLPAIRRGCVLIITQRAVFFENYSLDIKIILIHHRATAVSTLYNIDLLHSLNLRTPLAAISAIAHQVKLTFLLSLSNTLKYNIVALW